jgi:hypothetical protein
MNRLIFLIQILDNWLGIVSSGGSKYINGIDLVHLLQKLHAVWSHIELEFVSFEGE